MKKKDGFVVVFNDVKPLIAVETRRHVSKRPVAHVWGSEQVRGSDRVMTPADSFYLF